MEWLTQTWLRLKAIVGRRQLEQDLEDELAFHVAARGGEPEARKHTGNATVWKERTRDLWTFGALERLAQDLRYAGRMVRRGRLFTVVAILSLALGIGATTAIFSLMDALMLRPLPVQSPEQLVVLSNSYSFQAYEAFRDHNKWFSGILGTALGRAADVDPGSGQEQAVVELVTGSYFPVLGVPSVLGRTLGPDDDRVPGAHPVAVLSDAYWERRFQRDPEIVGRTIRVQRFPFTVIGVAAPGFSGLVVDQTTDIWVPLSMQREVIPGSDWLTFRPGNEYSNINVFGRLKPGITAGEAQPGLSALWIGQQEATHGTGSAAAVERMKQRIKQRPLTVEPGWRGLSYQRRIFSLPLTILMVTTGLVLLIACANLANLLLARSGARRREMAVRLSLGAGRRRLIRQMLTETGLLAACGALLGLGVAHWGVRILLAMMSRDPSSPLTFGSSFDGRVLGFTILVSAATVLLFGLSPALRSTRMSLSSSLKQGNVAGGDRTRSSRMLTMAQISLSVILLFGAGLFLHTLGNLRSIDLGLNTEHLIQVRLDPRQAGYAGKEYVTLCRALTDRLERVPGVRSVTLSGNGLFDGYTNRTDFSVPGFSSDDPDDRTANWDVVAPGYFTELGARIAAGRDFGPQDTAAAPKVMLVNESLARHYFGDRNPIGRIVKARGADREIVGVVRDTRDYAVRQPAKRLFYLPFFQADAGTRFAVHLIVRTAANPQPVMNLVRDAIRSQDPALSILGLDSIPALIDRQLNVERTLATLSGYFAVLALLLVGIGVHGVLSHEVVRRTREIGIRVALGAQRSQVLWTVARESVALVAAGTLLGLTGAVVLSRYVESLLFELKPADPSSMAAALGAVLLAAVSAAFLPALRASRLDPARTLREE